MACSGGCGGNTHQSVSKQKEAAQTLKGTQPTQFVNAFKVTTGSNQNSRGTTQSMRSRSAGGKKSTTSGNPFK